MNSIVVTSHIGRDLLQSANIFKTGEVAVWEYVVNGIEYITPGTIPNITVDINNKKKSIVITDNGRGMDEAGLSNFFTMHGENIDRKSGKLGRGKFGTGKSAAFGIGNKLVVSSTHDGLTNTISLHRDDIEKSDGGEIPVNILESNVPSDDTRSGTTIRIEEIFLPKIDAAKIIKKIEKYLQSFRQLNPQILVGDHVCSYKEPNFNEQIIFKPEGKIADVIGNVELVVKVSQSPLAQDERGILITCGEGNLIALEDAGVCSKDMGEYLFGEIDVPNIEDNDFGSEVYDSSRDMKLRPEHPVSIALTMFIGSSLEEVRKELVNQKRENLKTEESKKLKEQADKIADLLNKDFKELNDKLLEIRSSTSNIGKLLADSESLTNDSGEDGWVGGLEDRGFLDGDSNPDLEFLPGTDNVSDKIKKPKLPVSGYRDDAGNAALDSVSEKKNKRARQPKGGFSVEYTHMGADQDRATYTLDKGVFTVNLDHPVVSSASKNLGISDIGFQRLSHEIIFTEYALALANMAAVDDPDIPADDVIFDARDTLNRISVKSALLYES